jgi:hypothetical protein
LNGENKRDYDMKGSGISPFDYEEDLYLFLLGYHSSFYHLSSSSSYH